jgi:hypothetical protein
MFLETWWPQQQTSEVAPLGFASPHPLQALRRKDPPHTTKLAITPDLSMRKCWKVEHRLKTRIGNMRPSTHEVSAVDQVEEFTSQANSTQPNLNASAYMNFGSEVS